MPMIPNILKHIFSDCSNHNTTPDIAYVINCKGIQAVTPLYSRIKGSLQFNVFTDKYIYEISTDFKSEIQYNECSYALESIRKKFIDSFIVPGTVYLMDSDIRYAFQDSDDLTHIGCIVVHIVTP